MPTPTIVVKQNIETDVQEFIKFMYRWSPEKQKLIIRTYPALADAVQQGEKIGQGLVADFVREQYRIHREQIAILVVDIEKQIQIDGTRVLEALGTVMEYSWTEDNDGYTVIPTLLPFSPLQQPVFFFSLERFLRTKAHSVASSYGITAVLAHEVSHFIFFDLLNQLSDDMRIKCDKTIKHFAKEILAPIVMNDARLNDILHLTDYGGNPFLKYIMVLRESKEESIVVFFQTEYERQHMAGVSFIVFVSYIIETLFSIQPELQERLTLWDTHGTALLSDVKLNSQYRKPIEIKK